MNTNTEYFVLNDSHTEAWREFHGGYVGGDFDPSDRSFLFANKESADECARQCQQYADGTLNVVPAQNITTRVATAKNTKYRQINNNKIAA